MMVYDYKKRNTSFIESINILGQEYKLEPGVYVYEFDSENNVIEKDDSGTGCKPIYQYKISKIYENAYATSGGIAFFIEGQTYADFRLKFMRKDKIIAYYYFTINFDNPLEKESGC